MVFSLQLGLGALTAFASYNKLQHNLVRDCCVLIAGQIVWLVLSCLLSLALLGVAHSRQVTDLTSIVSLTLHIIINNANTTTCRQAINLNCVTSPAECDMAIVSVTGKDIWLVTMTIIETSLASVSFGWLWAGLLLLLLVITGMTSLFGYLEVLLLIINKARLILIFMMSYQVITSSLVAFRPSMLPYKPLLGFIVLIFLFLVDLLLATQVISKSGRVVIRAHNL